MGVTEVMSLPGALLDVLAGAFTERYQAVRDAIPGHVTTLQLGRKRRVAECIANHGMPRHSAWASL